MVALNVILPKEPNLPMNRYSIQFLAIAIVTTLWSLASPSAYGQLTLITSDTMRISGSATQFELVGYGLIANTGATPLNIRWKRVGVQLPSTWTCTVCDLNNCFPPFVDSADFVLPARDTANLDGHFYPNNQAGSGYQRISLRNLANPTATQFITYIGSTLGSGQFQLTHTEHEIAWRQLGQQLWISVPDHLVGNTVQIVDVSGKVMLSSVVTEPVQAYDLQALPAGVYLAQLPNGPKRTGVYRFYVQP